MIIADARVDNVLDGGTGTRGMRRTCMVRDVRVLDAGFGKDVSLSLWLGSYI